MKRDGSSQPGSWQALATSGPGEVRVGPLRAIPDLLTKLGVNPLEAFAAAGCDPQILADAEGRAPIESLGRLLAACARLTRCPHFGLLVGEHFDLSAFGTLGELLHHCATVGDAVEDLIRHLHLHDRAAAPLLLDLKPGIVLLGYSVFDHATRALAQIQDTAIAIANRIMSELCGPQWRPLRVQFAHRPPDSLAAHRRHFRADVAFDADVCGLVFASTWLQRTIEGADATRREFLAREIRVAQAEAPLSIAEQVRQVLPQLILNGLSSTGAVARLFAMHERTLRRRLEREGTNLQMLIGRTRFDLARQLLQNTDLSVTAIATALHYDDPNAFSRAFRSWASLSPRQWRARAGARDPLC